MRVAVVGAGAWGTAVAALAARGAETTLWARRDDLATAIDGGENTDYLPGFALPEALRCTSDLEEAVAGADVLVMGVPSHGFRSVLREAAPFMRPGIPVVSLTKGIEQDTLQMMTEVVTEETDAPPHRVGVLTGPNLAKEIMAGQPAASVIAVQDQWEAERLQSLFMAPTFRVYTNPDVRGCESAGALKNVMALASGMAHGLGYGDNSKAALITRALAELTRLGVALGGQALTYAGLAGMGDLVATCFSTQSRNRTVGVALGEGEALQSIVDRMQMVAEGVKTTKAVLALAHRNGIEMPIAEMVGGVLDGAEPIKMVTSLMGRAARSEVERP